MKCYLSRYPEEAIPAGQNSIVNPLYQPAVMQPTGLQDGEGHHMVGFNSAYYHIVPTETSTPRGNFERKSSEADEIEEPQVNSSIDVHDGQCTSALQWDEISNGAAIVRESLMCVVSRPEVCKIFPWGFSF